MSLFGRRGIFAGTAAHEILGDPVPAYFDGTTVAEREGYTWRGRLGS